MSESDAVRRSREPQTSLSLARDMQALGLRPDTVVCLHASLSSLGWVCGGPQAVVAALRMVLGPTGTLVVPTHTSSLTDPAGWQHPAVPEAWWPELRRTMSPFRPDITPSRRMGAIAEQVRTWPGARRSDHPQVSFAALGYDAAEIVNQHGLDHMLGESSPLARLYDLDAQVLLLGVGYDRNTSLHLAEYRAGIRPATTNSSPVDVDITDPELPSVWASWPDIELDETDFEAIGRAFEEQLGDEAVAMSRVGLAEARLMSQRALIDFAVSWFQRSARR